MYVMFLAIGFLVLRTPKLVVAQGLLGFTGVYWERTFGAYWGALRVSVLNSQLLNYSTTHYSTTHYSLLTTH